MAEDIAQWLATLGLGQYAQAFVENDIDLRALPHLSEDDLKELGLSLGHRRILQGALKNQVDVGEPAGARDPAGQPDSKTGHDAERRQLTVMFCDLVGSTALSGQLDPEDLREVMRSYQETVAGVVSSYDGHVAKYLGDGVLAYFGWPRAHEDDAERAIRTGLDTVKAVTALASGDGLKLQARIGLATGPVVIGDFVGGALAEEGAIAGETPNLAARLQDIAEPESVVISESTHRLAGTLFECRDLGNRNLKGIAEPVGAWAVVRPRRAVSRFDVMRATHLADLVGREEEVQILLRRWQRAKAGEGQVIVISGEAGIGKSRLARTLAERIADEPHTPIRLQCSPFHTSSALHPFIEHFEHAAGFSTGDTNEAKLDKLEGLLAQSGAAGKDVPLFAALLSIPTEGRYPPIVMSAQHQRELTLDVLAERLVRLADRQPVLLILEDAHWIDPTTLEQMELVLERALEARVMAIITHRPDFVAPWVGRSQVTALTLNRLRRTECAALATRVAGAAALPEAVIERIVARTDGVPLFVEELTRTVLESGSALASPSLEIPENLHESLQARLDRLGPAKEAAQIGAVIGRTFDYGLLSFLVPASGETLTQTLAQLVESGLISVRGEPPEATYAFKHALVQDTAYGSLLRTRRAELHGKVARALVDCDPGIALSEPELLAHHFTEAGQVGPAIDQWRAAAQKSMLRSANREAVEQLNRGFDLLKKMPATPDRDRKELELQTTLGQVMTFTRGWAAPEAAACYSRARELCVTVGEDQELFPILWGFWMIHGARGEQKAWRQTADEMLEIARRRGDKALLLQAHHASWGNPFQGNFTFQMEHIEKGLQIYDSAEHSAMAPRYGGHDAGVCALYHKGFALWATGYPEQSAAAYASALNLANDIAHPPSVAHALNLGSWLHALRGDWSKCLTNTEEAIELAQSLGNRTWLGRMNVIKGWAHVELGAAELGLAEMREALERDHVMYVIGTGTKHAMYAEALRTAGMAEQALSMCDEALSAVDEYIERFWEANIYSLKGDLLVERSKGDRTEAEICYQKAIEVAQDQKAKMWELRAAIRLARLWNLQGRTAEARNLLAPVYGWFTEGFDTPDLKEAKALLEALS